MPSVCEQIELGAGSGTPGWLAQDLPKTTRTSIRSCALRLHIGACLLPAYDGLVICAQRRCTLLWLAPAHKDTPRCTEYSQSTAMSEVDIQPVSC